eukprot:12058454-Prorocentrum_lima.AAC.1
MCIRDSHRVFYGAISAHDGTRGAAGNMQACQQSAAIDSSTERSGENCTSDRRKTSCNIHATIACATSA